MWSWIKCYLSGHHEYGVWCEPGGPATQEPRATTTDDTKVAQTFENSGPFLPPRTRSAQPPASIPGGALRATGAA